jgi:hypothetical protein
LRQTPLSIAQIALPLLAGRVLSKKAVAAGLTLLNHTPPNSFTERTQVAS